MKKCRRCGENKPAADFKRDVRYKDGISSFCRKCHSEASRAWQKANPERLNATRRERHARKRDEINAQRKSTYNVDRVRDLNRRRLYKVYPERYAELLSEQSGRCAICKRKYSDFARPLAIDHDHACCAKPPTCGKCTRGLLCPQCNTAIHSIERDGDWMSAAATYLKRGRSNV